MVELPCPKSRTLRSVLVGTARHVVTYATIGDSLVPGSAARVSPSDMEQGVWIKGGRRLTGAFGFRFVQVKKVLGKGSYGKVYKVQRNSDDQYYALKVGCGGAWHQLLQGFRPMRTPCMHGMSLHVTAQERQPQRHDMRTIFCCHAWGSAG